ncbi:MAG: 3'(2'),5'-bisphosphate nucleotidase CysQ [Rickettsiales bacterium]|nr:3'(2'),5'-bisphosphate nucleotidase CysQ [Rickettsiales bacterium]
MADYQQKSDPLNMKNDLFLNDLCRIAQKGGAAIMPYFGQPIDVERKADASPVTQADLAAHKAIVPALRELTPDIPIVSEEHKNHDLPEGVERFWLVDPLDGTKSFIRGENEFTVNIGLIEHGTPTLGIIYIPVEKMMYVGKVGQGAYRQKDSEEKEMITTRTPPEEGLSAVVSLSHLDPKTEDYMQGYTVAHRVSAASSLKFCRVAEGVADVYPRFGPTMEWDTAAGHAIAVAAGARVEKPDGSVFDYGKSDLLNGPFVVWGQ